MRCSHCGHRAIGLLGWFGHSLYQPIWREDRFVVRCRRCKTRLGPSARDRAFRWALPAIALGATFAVISQLPPHQRPLGIVQGLIAIFVALLAHYPLATYESLDPEADDLPQARTREQ